jgi:hypothetical protein
MFIPLELLPHQMDNRIQRSLKLYIIRERDARALEEDGAVESFACEALELRGEGQKGGQTCYTMSKQSTGDGVEWHSFGCCA